MRLMFAHWMIACARTQSMNGRPWQEDATPCTTLLEGKGKLLKLTSHWLIHPAIAAGYALIYLTMAGLLSNAPWPFTAGLRIACLLLVPYRYWPALIAGEMAPLAYRNLAHADDFGPTWAVLASIPPLVIAMPLAWWFRERAALFPTRDLVDVKKLFYCTLSLSALWAATSYAITSTIHLRDGNYHIPSGTAFSFFIDFYMALLTVTPWTVIACVYKHGKPHPFPSRRAIATSPIARDALIAAFLFIALTGLYWIVPTAIRPAVMMVLFFPALGLTLKHGWRASVFGGTLCLISISVLVEWRPDPNTQLIQSVLAFTITCLYVFGARLSMQMRLLEQFQRETLRTQQIAKRSLVFGEQRLQQTSQALECVAGALRMDYVRVMQRFVPEEVRRDYGKDFLDVQKQVYHLAESIHPSAWRERGLAAALEESIGKVLREAGIAYSCETPGRKLRFLSEALQATVYRMVCEAAATISASPACIGVHLTLRTGMRHGVQRVALCMDGMLEESQVAYGILQAKERQSVAPKLGASIKPGNELKMLARLFQGNARMRTIPAGVRFTALLCDAPPQDLSQRVAMGPVRLWAQ